MVFKKISNFLEKWDEWIIAGMLIPFAKGLFEKFSSKAGEKVEEKIEKILGIKVDEHGKGFGDEILTREAIRVMSEEEQKIIEAFRIWLRESNPEKADAFTLGIAKAVKSFERQVKKTVIKGNRGDKGKPKGPQEREETIRIEYDHSWSTNFFKRLLSYKTNAAKENFVFAGENFISLVPPAKKSASAVNLARRFCAKVQPAFAKTATAIHEGQSANLADLQAGLARDRLALERARQRRAERKMKVRT